MSGGHWFDPESAEQYIEALEALRARTGNYDQKIREDLSKIEARLVANDQGLAEYLACFKGQVASMFLELELETRQLRQAFEKSAKEQTEFERQKLDVEERKLQLEAWKLVAGLVVAFLGGLLFPLALRIMGVTP
ncbi:MAG: hypothetical protein JXA78_18630 [Anaerolineales bacterium]|nr:hypothetical protein [Anaerolineales bacterium]